MFKLQIDETRKETCLCYCHGNHPFHCILLNIYKMEDLGNKLVPKTCHYFLLLGLQIRGG